MSDEGKEHNVGDASFRILVIDDEEPNLETFRRVFRRDFRMMFARSVASAVELLHQHAFDMALVDYAMPGENGIAFLRHAASHKPDMACVMMTAHADLSEVKQAVTGGLARGVIMKPWDRSVILRWVENTKRLASLKKSVTNMMTRLDRK